MPELTPQSSAPLRNLPPPPAPPPPKVIASSWEEWEGFRFTFLRHFPRPEDTAALRGLSQLLYDMALENPRHQEETYPAPETRWEMVAVLSELRFLEGYLASVFEEQRVSSLPAEVEELCRFAGGLSVDLGHLADRLNDELAKWRA